MSVSLTSAPARRLFAAVLTLAFGLAAHGAAVLKHRYSFNEPAGATRLRDSVGGLPWDGFLRGNGGTLVSPITPTDGSAVNGTGQLILNGVDGFVDLPNHIVSTLTNFTIETWVTWTDPAANPNEHIFDFGDGSGTEGSANGLNNYIYFTPKKGSTPQFSLVDASTNGGGACGCAIKEVGAVALPINQQLYLALVFDPVGGVVKLYTNGVLYASTNSSLAAGNWPWPLSSIHDVNDWLGRSENGSFPNFKGIYDEFRIWKGVLSDAEIATNAGLGPNVLPPGQSQVRLCATIYDRYADFVEFEGSPGGVTPGLVANVLDVDGNPKYIGPGGGTPLPVQFLQLFWR